MAITAWQTICTSRMNTANERKFVLLRYTHTYTYTNICIIFIQKNREKPRNPNRAHTYTCICFYWIKSKEKRETDACKHVSTWYAQMPWLKCTTRRTATEKEGDIYLYNLSWNENCLVPTEWVNEQWAKRFSHVSIWPHLNAWKMYAISDGTSLV